MYTSIVAPTARSPPRRLTAIGQLAGIQREARRT
jgi:hypothetical protein